MHRINRSTRPNLDQLPIWRSDEDDAISPASRRWQLSTDRTRMWQVPGVSRQRQLHTIGHNAQAKSVRRMLPFWGTVVSFAGITKTYSRNNNNTRRHRISHGDSRTSSAENTRDDQWWSAVWEEN